MELLIGIDIGGTKCALVYAKRGADRPEILEREAFPTPGSWQEAFCRFRGRIGRWLAAHPEGKAAAVGVSCGGPLDSRAGLILSPPNLPGWDRVDCLRELAPLGLPAALRNDADACALAEWRWGAGRGTRDMAFLTFGTGMGAGLILDGKLYTGRSGLAGEAGHIRLCEDGPEGYGKRGSFEGFCSGGGIARMGREAAEKALAAGNPPAFCPDAAALPGITARSIGEAADAGGPLALEIYRRCGFYLGRGLAVLIDLLNPERIVIGSIFVRQEALLRPPMEEVLRAECLAGALAACRVVPAGLGEQIGDYACLSIAEEAARQA